MSSCSTSERAEVNVIGLYLYFSLCSKPVFKNFPGLLRWVYKFALCPVCISFIKKYFCYISFWVGWGILSSLEQLLLIDSCIYTLNFKVKDDGILEMKVDDKQIWNWWSARTPGLRFLFAFFLGKSSVLSSVVPPTCTLPPPQWISINEIILFEVCLNAKTKP